LLTEIMILLRDCGKIAHKEGRSYLPDKDIMCT
jgi:hypothetical protein